MNEATIDKNQTELNLRSEVLSLQMLDHTKTSEFPQRCKGRPRSLSSDLRTNRTLNRRRERGESLVTSIEEIVPERWLGLSKSNASSSRSTSPSEDSSASIAEMSIEALIATKASSGQNDDASDLSVSQGSCTSLWEELVKHKAEKLTEIILKNLGPHQRGFNLNTLFLELLFENSGILAKEAFLKLFKQRIGSFYDYCYMRKVEELLFKRNLTLIQPLK